jgi:hypothetical protein
MAVLPLTQWLESGKVSEQISRIVVSDAGGGDGILVEIHEPTFKRGQRNPKPIVITSLRAWLLKADGSAVRQIRPVQYLGVVNEDAGYHGQLFRFHFAPTAREELRGVVVELAGKMFVREISVRGLPGHNVGGSKPK